MNTAAVPEGNVNSVSEFSVQELHSALVDIPTRNKTLILDTQNIWKLRSIAEKSQVYEVYLRVPYKEEDTTRGEKQQTESSLVSQIEKVLGETIERGPLSQRLSHQSILDELRRRSTSKQNDFQALVGRVDFVGAAGPTFLRSERDSWVDAHLAYRRNWDEFETGLIEALHDEIIRLRTEALLPDYISSIGRAFLDKRRFKQAISVLQRISSEKPEALLMLGIAQMALGEYEKGARSVRTALTSSGQLRLSGDIRKEILSIPEGIASSRKAALPVGIDDYASAELTPLHSPGPNVEVMKSLLVDRYGFAEGDIHILRNSQATRSNIIAEVETLVAKTRFLPGVFYFSGHGTHGADGRIGIMPVDVRTSGTPDISLQELANIAGEGVSQVISIFDSSFIYAPANPDQSQRARQHGANTITPVPDAANTQVIPVGRVSIIPDFSSIPGRSLSIAPLEPIGESELFDRSGDGKLKVYGHLTYSLAEVLRHRDADALSYEQLPELVRDRSILKFSLLVIGKKLEEKFLSIPNPAAQFWIRCRSIFAAPTLVDTVNILRRAIDQRNQKYPEGFLNLGIALAEIDNYESSVEALETAIG